MEAEVPKQMQIVAIEGADLPDVFKNLLLENNNSEVYQKLGVTTFAEYVSKYFAKLVIEIVAFLVTFLFATIVIRAVVFALDFVTALPVLGILNKMCIRDRAYPCKADRGSFSWDDASEKSAHERREIF